MIKEWIKFFGSFTLVGLLMIYLGKYAVADPEIRNFSGGGPVLAANMSAAIGAIFFSFGVYGIASELKKIIAQLGLTIAKPYGQLKQVILSSFNLI